jgi:hypothetical protein
MNVFFDVDFTILGLDGTLRPGTVEVFEQLLAAGHTLYIWSGVGDRTHDVQRRGLDRFVSGVYQKPLHDFDLGLARYNVPVTPDFVIDDYPEIVAHFGGFHISPYVDSGAVQDTQLLQVPELVEERQRLLGLPSSSADPV